MSCSMYMLPAGDMWKFVLLLFTVAGFNARPLQYNDLRIQNGGWVIGAPQLVQNGQEYMGNSLPADIRQQDRQPKPQWEVVLAPEQTLRTQADTNHRVASIDEHRQGTETSKRFVVDLNTGLLKEYVVYNPVSNAEFRQGTQNSRATLVDIRTGQLLPQLSEMQRRAEPLSQFRQGTEYSEPNLMELRKGQKSYNPASDAEFRQGTQNSRVTLVDIRTGQQLPQLSEMQRRAEPLSQFRQGTEYSEANLMELRKDQKSYNPASDAEFRQGTQNSRVTLVDIRTGQQLPQLSEMQRRPEPFEFIQGTEYSLVNLMNLRKTKMTSKFLHSVQDIETNEVYPEFKRGIAYSQAQRRRLMTQHRFHTLENNEVDMSDPGKEFRHGKDYIYANVIDRRLVEPSYV